MSRIFILRNIFLQHKYQLLVTYVLFGLEMLGSLMRPFFLGMAVNDLIKGSYNGLACLAGSHVLYLLAGTVRHRYDTRTYTAIYTSLVTRLLSRRFENAEISKLSAHSTLSREFIDFLEYDLNYVIEAIYNLFGSLVLIFIYDRKVVTVCLLVMLPVMIISYFYGKRMKKLNKAKNDELEKQVDIISTRDKRQINAHYQNLRKWQIKISDKEAMNFGVMELFALVVITVSIFVISKTGNATPMPPGDIAGIYIYILTFIRGLDTIPYMGQRLASLKDIIQRIQVEADETELPRIKPVLRPILNPEKISFEKVS
jgi:ABC-type multidrug transport system fused ATPase/permease subunit